MQICFYNYIINIKNRFITNLICYILFTENVQQIILKYIYDSFQFMDIDYMNKINYIIKNSYLADVKDEQWRDISAHTKFVYGIDLSTGEVNNKNTYEYIKTIIKSRNQNLNQNEVFNINKSILYSNNEYNVMIINLLFYYFWQWYYTNKDNMKKDENIDNNLDYNPLEQPFFNSVEN